MYMEITLRATLYTKEREEGQIPTHHLGFFMCACCLGCPLVADSETQNVMLCL